MGMPKIEFRLQMFRGDWDQIWSQMRLLWAMEGLCRINQTHLRQFNEFAKRGLIEKPYPPLYKAGLHYETEKGTEIWPDIPSMLAGTMGKGVYPGKWGDCLPVSTLVMRDDYTLCPIVELAPGDRIMGDGGLTTVIEQGITGEKPILAFDLDNGSTFRCSPNHRLFLDDGSEIRAEDVKVNQKLRLPTKPFDAHAPLQHGRLSDADYAWLLGLYIAEGWNDYPRHSRFCISGRDGKRKEEQKHRVKALMEKIGVHTRWHERYIAVNDRELANEMSRCGGRAPSKHLPTLCMSREQVVATIEGLSADCSIASRSGTIVQATTSEMLALQFRILYRILGQSVHIRRWDEHGGLGSNPIYRINVRKSYSERKDARSTYARVKAIKEDGIELCADITTDTGRFWLPESDLIVHNCEDFACWRVAEYRELPWHYERPDPTRKGGKELADPLYPQGKAEMAAHKAGKPWPGWKKVKGGIKAKPFAKWRRGPKGNYHYHALVLLPDGKKGHPKIEDPSLVLGMGKEKWFSDNDIAGKMQRGEIPVKLRYAKPPDVMVVDPEKPSGFAGGKATKMDAKIMALVQKGMSPEGVAATLGDVELGAFLANEIPLGEGEFDVDQTIGWSRAEGCFSPKSAAGEARRLLGYAKH